LEFAKLGHIRVHNNISEVEVVLGPTLGAGTFAQVKQATWNGKQVAVKIFNENTYSFRLEDFMKEVVIMSLVKHNNLLKLLGACIVPRKENSTYMLVTELMHKGTLMHVIKSNGGPLPLNFILKYSLAVAQGLAHLHSLDMIHRDIKATNILVDENDIAKVGDLGLSRVNNLYMTGMTGTPKWEAPECLSSSLYTKSADVYSYGVVLGEMVTGEEPFPEIREMCELKKAVCDQKQRPKLPAKAANCPEFLSSIIKACWAHEPKKRPTFEQIVEKLSLQQSTM